MLPRSPTGMAKAAWDQVPANQKAIAYRAIDKFWKHTGSETSNARVLFRKHATRKGKDETGPATMNMFEARAMKNALCDKLDIPREFFFDLDVQFKQFDFDGDGLLNLDETVKLIKNTLKQRRAASSSDEDSEDDPDQTVQQSTLEERGYIVVRELGRGGQGVMYLANKEQSGGWWMCTASDDKDYCIKFYSKGEANAGGVKELVDEFSRMKQFSNQHVAKTFEAFQDQNYYYLVNEPYMGGDWTKLAHKAHTNGVNMSEKWWRNLFKQTLQGLDYLHRMAQMHCDIKEPNIMTYSTDYESPRAVFIDFGLAQGFASKASGISGTPGYIPPETWETQTWFPLGDIFSLGVVFFQMLSGRVPSSDGAKRGIFQEGAKDVMDVGRVTLQAQPPWQQFPMVWRPLANMINNMLAKQSEQRPRATQLLQDPWLSSRSDLELPKSNLAAMVSGSSAAFFRSELINALCKQCTLRDLRELDRILANDSRAPGGWPMQGVPANVFIQRLQQLGLERSIIDDFIGTQGNRGMILYSSLLQEVVKEKEIRSDQLVTNLFNEMDWDDSGYLSPNEIRSMLESDAFECDYEDVDAVLQDMDLNRDGYVSYEEMKRTVMEDGRIACKDVADRGEKPTKFWFKGLF